ncbi:alpha-L-arabinofuranosidase 1-like isoform X1 [Phragmites australis]|uniref:alpha-L-arabinofuranosidase 1-like isoform X1 n=1 Tax=Phragmites australis TaxID=29695 RepID=UPI002D76F5A6|nr:alpha-L-arabinofuranosidase 1-like isoform X1 [Phragmites australis]XP_062215768.1 alpha-L-arabinofuranosidase 1-like isoform X1 [Phragmites australis]XP_062215769.1 alpha-L-arabinofuranosidase 1-like isoform X1 [Phragmites australis]XP_062215770.1 alpha-L-arabinofuranosidase 1-like isoform X1 [Phragmites australis]XP_062215771.1 alpha-L-arabinofuranosidase 1-like isoform X1 [Phragmites australis]XP_062215772.1 alpha-L-arabinofuranosidase 1-like isoform X1 [Phragmites australis]
MGVPRACSVCWLFRALVLVCTLYLILSVGSVAAQTAQLSVDASPQNAQMIPGNMFGIFFEEINHAGAGGLWAELVSNRGFEAGGSNTPSNIDPWLIIGDESNIIVATDRSSCFPGNPIALRMEVLCEASGTNTCPLGGVGIYNPGYWGMNIERAKVYKVSMYIMSSDSVDLTVSLTSSDGLQNLAAHAIMADKGDFAVWTKVEFDLQSNERNTNSRLQLTTSKSGIIWFDQVSLMPSDTYMGHGFRKDLVSMLANLKPQFLKFPGGNYVMGNYLLNAFRWSETVGPWEERPGHFNDAWGYWTDDGLGFFEFLQLAEDLGACPVWVVNDGASLNEEVPSATIAAFVKDVVDGIEFARGDIQTTWGSVRAAMGHPEPFQLYYVSIGNQECSRHYYKENYVKFYSAIKASYPDVKVISSCDRSTISPLNPADLYDVHVYASSGDMFSKSRMFDNAGRSGPKAIVSEYAVTGNDAGRGTLIAALAEAAFLIGLERNSDVVEMASCAPLFANDNDRRWNPDAIVFNSWQHYGCPNYWMLHFFKDSSGATLHPATIQLSNYDQLVTSAITWKNPQDGNTYLKIKVVNFGNQVVSLNISVTGLETEIQTFGSIKTVLTSGRLRDENSFQQPDKVVPVASPITNAREQMGVVLDSYSLTSFDLLVDSSPTMHSLSGSSLHSSV